MKKSLMQPKNSQQSKRGNYHQKQPRPLLEMPATAETETRGMRRRQRRISTIGLAPRNRSAMPKRGGRKEVAGMEAENEAIEFRRRFASAESRRPNLAIPTDFDEEEAAEQLRRLPSLLARLETAMHFWEVGRPSGRKESVGILDEIDGTGFERIRPLDGRIPNNYGLLLNSDLPSMNDQLAGIRQNLIQLRQFGFSQPTAEYFQNYRRPLLNELHRPKTFSGIFRTNLMESPPPTLSQIRAHLLNMEFHVEKRIRELTTERRKLGNDGGENVKGSHNPMERMQWAMPPANIEKMQTTVQFEENLQKRPIQLTQYSFPAYSSNVRHESSSVPSQSYPNPNVWAEQIDEGTFQRSLDGAINSTRLTAAVSAPFVDDKPHVRPLVFGKSSQEIEMEKHIGLENVNELKLVEENTKNDEQSKTEKVENTIVPSANEGGGIGQTQGEESANFQRMLQVLKNPRRFDLSSSSSSDEEAADGPTKLPMNEVAPTTLQKNPSPSSQPPAATMSASFGATFPAGIQQKKGNESDSDSDFFK